MDQTRGLICGNAGAAPSRHFGMGPTAARYHRLEDSMISHLHNLLGDRCKAAAAAASLGVSIVVALFSCGADGAPPFEPDSLTAPILSQPIVRSPEPACSRPSTIICEDFESDDRSDWSDYRDDAFNVAAGEALGGQRAMRQDYALGQESAGWLAWFFGDHPLGGVRSNESFAEVYFRWYHRFQEAWPVEYPPKMARMRSHYIDCAWCFAWMEHFWIRSVGTAISDPMSNIAAPNGTQYSDTERWLGSLAAALSFDSLDGRWVALEMRIKLNSPGQDDGRITFWANGRTILDRTGMNLRGAYTGTSVNVAMIDTYWNGGAPVGGLRRWYDNVVVATEPVGCVTFTVEKSALAGQTSWQLAIALDDSNRTPVWDSGTIPSDGTSIDISQSTGTFAAGMVPCVDPSTPYVFRARQATQVGLSEWSEWAAMF